MRWYEQQINRLRVPVESHYVPTHAGRTHLLAAGPKEAPPLVVLHGMNMNAATMSFALNQFSSIRRVYAIDVIGMPGKSAGVRPSRKGDGYPRWLNEVMEELDVDRADFIGQSFGGWLTLKLAALKPERLRTAVLLDTAGIVPFTLWGQIWAGFTAIYYMLWPSKKNLFHAVKPFYAPTVHPDNHFAEFLGLTYRHTRMDIDPGGLPTLSRKDLATFDAPLFISYGKHDIFFDSRKAMQKAERLFSGPVVTELIEDQGHMLTDEAERELYNRIQTFLTVATA